MAHKPRRTHSQLAKSHPFTLSTGGHPEEGAGHRQARLEHILLHQLQSLISDEATNPSLDGIRLLSVHLSVDGGHARLAYAVVADISQEQQVGRASQGGLIRAAGFLRARLAQQLDLKKVPKLTFTFVGVTDGVLAGSGGADESGGGPWPE